eukprot:jgi/Chrzof1/3172/Cz12g14150.t1
MEASSDEFVKCLAKGVAVYSDAYGHAPVDTDDQAYLRTFTGRQAERSAQTGVVIADNLRLAQEYDAETARVREVLELCGMSVDSLSAKARLSVQLMAKVCNALEVRSYGHSQVMAAWAYLTWKYSKAAVLKAKLQQQSSRLDSSMKFSGKQLEQLQHLLHKTKAAQTKATKELHGEEQELKVLETKLKSYQTTLHKLQHKLQADGLTPELLHANLVAKHGSVKDSQQHLAVLKARLATYHNLPASVLGASMMLKQARERLQASEERLEAGLVLLE